MRKQQHARQQSKRSFWRRLITAATLIIFITGIAVVWIKTGQGPVATTLSIIFVLLAAIIPILQWLFPVSSNAAEQAVIHYIADATHRLTTIGDVTFHHEEEAVSESSLSRGSPFDEVWLSLPERFVGREENLRWLLRRLRTGGVTGITALNGMGGIGKTALAAVAVHQLRAENRFRHGVAVIFCQGLTDATDVVGRVLARFDPHHRQPQINTPVELSEAIRRMLKGKDALVVLDNIETALAIEHVVPPLHAAGVTLLLTMRHQLPVTVVPITATLRLDLLTLEEAVDLFAQAFGRVSAQNLTLEERSAVEHIVAALDRHTLSVKLAGAYAVGCKRNLRVLADELSDPRRAIRVFNGETPQAMTQVFAQSIEALPDDVQQLFTGLAAFSIADFGRRAALSLAGALGLTDPEECVDVLVRRALLDASPVVNMPEESDHERLRLHPLLRGFATERFLAWEKAKQDVCSRAVAQYYAAYAIRTTEAGLGLDEGNITGALEWAFGRGENNLVVVLCSGMRLFWYVRGRPSASLRYLPWAIAITEDIARTTNDRADRLRAADFTLAYGQVLELTGKPDDAEQVFKDNLVLRRDVLDRRGEGEVLCCLGKLTRVRGRLEEAEHYYQQALMIAQEVQDRREEGEVLRLLGEVAQVRGNLEKTEEYYQQALTIARKIQDRREEGEVLRCLGELAWWRGYLKEAKEYFQLALTIARDVQNRREEGWILATLGGLALRSGQLETAEQHLQHALRIDREVQNRNEEAWALLSMGKLAQAQSNPQEARAYFEQALSIDREVQNRSEEAQVLCLLGDVMLSCGQTEEALLFYQQSLAINHNRRDEGRILRSLGQLAQVCGRMREARAYFEHALVIDRDVQDRREEIEVLHMLGDVSLCFGHVGEAETYYQQAFTIAHEVQDQRGEGEIFHVLGKLAQAQGRTRDAKKYLHRALRTTRLVRNRRGEGEILHSLGILAQILRRQKKAREYLQQALLIDRETQNRREEGRVLAALGKLLLQERQVIEAENHYRQGLTILHEVQDAFNVAQIGLEFGVFLIEQDANREEGCSMLTQAVHYFSEMQLPHEQHARRELQRLGCD